mmetsp:Transcript_24304/g.53074  ORF Transcript_24304/g.53074 Transcript_24304/m.53074 type:complete len:439 (-) Transcript_24304:427-1743(-)
MRMVLVSTILCLQASVTVGLVAMPCLRQRCSTQRAVCFLSEDRIERIASKSATFADGIASGEVRITDLPGWLASFPSRVGQKLEQASVSSGVSGSLETTTREIARSAAAVSQNVNEGTRDLVQGLADGTREVAQQTAGGAARELADLSQASIPAGSFDLVHFLTGPLPGWTACLILAAVAYQREEQALGSRQMREQELSSEVSALESRVDGLQSALNKERAMAEAGVALAQRLHESALSTRKEVAALRAPVEFVESEAVRQLRLLESMHNATAANVSALLSRVRDQVKGAEARIRELDSEISPLKAMVEAGSDGPATSVLAFYEELQGWSKRVKAQLTLRRLEAAKDLQLVRVRQLVEEQEKLLTSQDQGERRFMRQRAQLQERMAAKKRRVLDDIDPEKLAGAVQVAEAIASLESACKDPLEILLKQNAEAASKSQL